MSGTAERHPDRSTPESTLPRVRPSWRRRLRRWTRRSEGELTLATAVIVGLCLLSGLVGALGLAQRADLLNSVAEQNAPLTEEIFTVYRSLADADATSANAFLAGGDESPSVRSTFDNDVATAASALISASALSATLPQPGALVITTGCTSSDPKPPAGTVAQRLDGLSRNLAVYTGLIETSRTYNRQGLPLGAAYLNQASTVLRRDMLPQAQILYSEESTLVAASDDQAAEFPWLALALVVVLVTALILLQVRLSRHTRRSFNIGLLVATLAVVGGGIWLVVAASVERSAVDTSRMEDTTQLQVLVGALTDAQQAHTDQAIVLILQGAGAQYEQDFKDQTICLNNALVGNAPSTTQPGIAALIGDARTTTDKWQNMSGAASITSSLTDRIDTDLSEAIDQVQLDSEDQIHGAREALAGTEAGFAVLIGIALVSAVAGMWQRIAEYR